MQTKIFAQIQSLFMVKTSGNLIGCKLDKVCLQEFRVTYAYWWYETLSS